MSLLLDGARLEIEDAALVGRLLRAQLLPDLVHVLGVDVLVHRRPEPLGLGGEGKYSSDEC